MTVFYNNYFVVFSDITSLLKETPNKEELLLLLEDISDKWYDIGLSLQVRRNVLDDLNQSEDNSEAKLEKVINIWKNTKSSSNTWETMIIAMDSPIINNKEIAVEIRHHLKFSKLLLLYNAFFLNITFCFDNIIIYIYINLILI